MRTFCNDTADMLRPQSTESNTNINFLWIDYHILFSHPDQKMHSLPDFTSEPYKFVALAETKGLLQLRGSFEELNSTQDPYSSIVRIDTGVQHCHAGFVDLLDLENNHTSQHLLTAHHCVSTLAFRNINLVIITALVGSLILWWGEKLKSWAHWMVLVCGLYYCFKDIFYVSFSPTIIKDHDNQSIGECHILEAYYIEDIALLGCTLQMPYEVKSVSPALEFESEGNLTIAVSMIGLFVQPEYVTIPPQTKISQNAVLNFVRLLNAKGNWLFHGTYVKNYFYVSSNVGSMPGFSGTLCFANNDYRRFVGVLTTFFDNQVQCQRPLTLLKRYRDALERNF